jgi:hypothetical protein
MSPDGDSGHSPRGMCVVGGEPSVGCMDSRTPARHPMLGLPLWGVALLALLAVPRVFVHDLGVDIGPLGQSVLALGPPALWVYVVLRARVPSPLFTLVTVSAVYGVALAIVHNVLWNSVFGDEPPTLGGNLRRDLTSGVESFVLRFATGVSSLFTGLVVGLLAGLAATVLRSFSRRRSVTRRR